MLPRTRRLYYGDNLPILGEKIAKDSVDLCYLDPPFNSKRQYNMIYLGEAGKAGPAQSQAFIDIWRWGKHAQQEYDVIFSSPKECFTKETRHLVAGLRTALRTSGLLAYLTSMTVRINAIWRTLKPTGSLYLHCDPSASHYLKLLLDSIFIPRGGLFINEIIWHYNSGPRGQSFGKRHDTIFWYAKSQQYTFNTEHVRVPYSEHINVPKSKAHYYHPDGKVADDVWQMPIIAQNDKRERLGFPTQKPETLLERIIHASSPLGGTILDPYCGCGTTIAVAERLKRQWIGIDITFQSISLVCKRLEDSLALKEDAITIEGRPGSLAAARALAHKQDDRLRKEFEKWAILTFTNNAGRINDQKGDKKGIDGRFLCIDTKDGKPHYRKGALQVKSTKVEAQDVAIFLKNMGESEAELGYLISLEPAPSAVLEAATDAGKICFESGRKVPRMCIISVSDLIKGARIELPLHPLHRKAAFSPENRQSTL